ncbi:unnamed protein product [Discosporangium mesarthrocarpum]
MRVHFSSPLQLYLLGDFYPSMPPKDYFNLMQLMEEASCTRDAARTSAVVSALVQHIMFSWREHFARAVAMKFNCFFLMPFVDDFPFYLRQELDKIYEGDVGEIFDIAEARGALVRRRDALVSECKACHEIRGKFDTINAQLNSATDVYGNGEDDEVAAAEEAFLYAELDSDRGAFHIEGDWSEDFNSEQINKGGPASSGRGLGEGMTGSEAGAGGVFGAGFVDEEDSNSSEDDVFVNPMAYVGPTGQVEMEAEDMTEDVDMSVGDLGGIARNSGHKPVGLTGGGANMGSSPSGYKISTAPPMEASSPLAQGGESSGVEEDWQVKDRGGPRPGIGGWGKPKKGLGAQKKGQ